MKRVFPNGKCWCGCGEPTERTSFFVPGHDKRAEAKVVKDVYGGVPEFLAAHGYGPEGRNSTASLQEGMDATGLNLLEQWNFKPFAHDRVHVVLEVLDPEDPRRARRRLDDFHVHYRAEDRAVFFDSCKSQVKVTVPFPDIAWVYIERKSEPSGMVERIVRLRGAIVEDRFLSFS